MNPALKAQLKPLLKKWFVLISGVPPRCNLLHPSYLHSRALNRALATVPTVIPSAGRVLDVGCGSKPYRHLFNGQGQSYTGLEFTPANKTGSRSDAPEVIADAHHLPIKPGSLDLVLVTEVLEHVAQPEIILHEVHRVLKPGGRVVVTLPFMFYQHDDPRDFRRLTPDGFRQMLVGTGLDFRIEITARLGSTGTVLLQTLQHVVYFNLQKTRPGLIAYYSLGLVLLPLFSLGSNALGWVLDKALPNPRVYSGLFSVLKKPPGSANSEKNGLR